MQQGRRTASLKASYEAVAGGDLAGHHAIHAAHHDHGIRIRPSTAASTFPIDIDEKRRSGSDWLNAQFLCLSLSSMDLSSMKYQVISYAFKVS